MQANAVKRLGFVVRRPDLSNEQFVDHWMNVHAPLCKRLPNLLRYSVHLVDRERFQDFGYDGFSELWFESQEALEASLGSPEGRTLLADLPNFTERIYPIISFEHHHIWP